MSKVEEMETNLLIFRMLDRERMEPHMGLNACLDIVGFSAKLAIRALTRMITLMVNAFHVKTSQRTHFTYI